MKRVWLAGLSVALLVGIVPARGADDPRVENLALCRDSWVDWKKTDPAKMESYVTFVRLSLTHNGNDPFAVPKSAMSIGGMSIKQVFPDSVGMGVGFSVLVDAKFDVAKPAFEKKLGKKLGKCETGDGMQACELPIAEQRTVTLMSGVPPNDTTTLIGCYYFYEK